MNRSVAASGRREFLVTAVAGLAAWPSIAESAESDGAKNPICVFTKPFNSLSFDELADRMAELGVDGIEAPIRRGGHVEPEQVEERLPLLVEALRKRKLEVTVMTTDVNDPNDPLTERVLRTAATLGIKRYRMQYFKYDLKQSVPSQLDQWRPQIRDLAALNHDFGIQGLYQNHAGRDYMGAALWDLQLVLQGIPVGDIGVAYDIRHATAEAGMSWPAALNMIRASIDTIYVKDFDWKRGESHPINVPLGEGRVDPKFMQLVKRSEFAGPVSLHEEYLDHSDPSLVPKHLAAIKKDIETLRSWL
jgi:sugar phosphate isomerase/epimerase